MYMKYLDLVSLGELVFPDDRLTLPRNIVYPHRRISCDGDFDEIEDKKIRELKKKLAGEFFQVLYPIPKDNEFDLFIGPAYGTLDYLFEKLKKYQRFRDLFNEKRQITASQELPNYVKNPEAVPGIIKEFSDEDFKRFQRFIAELNHLVS